VITYGWARLHPVATDLPSEQAARVVVAVQRILDRENGVKTRAAARIGISRQSVGYLISGVNSPSYETAGKVAEALGIPLEQLLGPRLPEDLAPTSRAVASRPPPKR
jgi:transcriptional regulator with XRE-family HTH domain